VPEDVGHNRQVREDVLMALYNVTRAGMNTEATIRDVMDATNLEFATVAHALDFLNDGHMSRVHATDPQQRVAITSQGIQSAEDLLYPPEQPSSPAVLAAQETRELEVVLARVRSAMVAGQLRLDADRKAELVADLECLEAQSVRSPRPKRMIVVPTLDSIYEVLADPGVDTGIQLLAFVLKVTATIQGR